VIWSGNEKADDNTFGQVFNFHIYILMLLLFRIFAQQCIAIFKKEI